MRDPVARLIYSSAAWRKLAKGVRDNATGCAWCGASGVYISADHIASIRDRPDLALEPSNVVAACRSCQERRKYNPDVRTWR
jgi:hypothetical protein